MEGLSQALHRWARDTPHRVAFRDKRNGTYRTWTYGEVYDTTRWLIERLRADGVEPGERVGLFGENSPEWVLTYLAVHLLGGVVVPLDAQYSERELSTLLPFAEVRTLCHGDAHAEKAAAVARKLSLARRIPYQPLLAEAGAPPGADLGQSFDPDALMTLIFTSGTTGDPKGVRLSVGNVYSNIDAIKRLELIRPDDIALGILPLHHAYAMNTVMLGSLFIGAAVTFCHSLAAADLLAAVRETRVTIFPGVPRLFEAFDQAIQQKLNAASRLRRLLAEGMVQASRRIRRATGRNPGRLLFRPIHRTFGPSLRFFACGGAKLDPAIAERFLDLGLVLVEGYGLSETAPVLCFDTPDHPHPGTVGRPLHGIEIRIDQPDESGVGEIIARGPNIMQGYEKRPDATREVLRDGWFHTGDLGYVDDDGCLHITGRAKEVIVLPSGKNIYPEELEKHYEQSRLVRELCIVPSEAPDGRVERLHAVVVPDEEECRRRRTVSIEPAVRQEIGALAQELPSYLRVQELTLIRQELPRTRLGKLRRPKVMELLAAERRNRTRETERPPSPEEQALLDIPGADQLLARIRGLSPHHRPVALSDHLELDVGLDSVGRVELDAMLEKEFGIRIEPAEIADIQTVRDILERLPEARQAAGRPVAWQALLSERAEPPLEEMFNLRRNPITRGAVHTVRRLVYLFARVALRLDVRGLERLPPHGPYLLCPNHASLMDGPLVFISLPFRVIERMFFLGVESRFQTPLMKWFGKVGRVIPTATRDTLRASLQRTAEAVAMGRPVCIFPEGEVTRDGALRPPRPGAGILACELGVPLVPVLVRGTFRSLSITHPKFRLVPVGVTIGRPIHPPSKDAYAADDYQAVVDRWAEAIAALRREDDASGGPTAGQSPRVDWVGRRQSPEPPRGDHPPTGASQATAESEP